MRSPYPLLLLCLAAGCAAAGAGDRAPDAAYQVGRAERGDIQVLVEETGVVEPEHQIVVKSPISGVVAGLAVREGDRVVRGQRLATVRPDIAQANAFARLRADIETARIRSQQADQDYRRAEELGSGKGVTEAQLQELRTTRDAARNDLSTAEEQLRLVRASGVNLQDTSQQAVVTSPAAGVVIARGVEVGETVVGGTSTYGGGTEMFTVADLSSLLVKAPVNEVDIGKVARGDSVHITVDAFPDDTVLGIVRLVPPAARQDERVRVFDVEIRVVNPGSVLHPGMTANVQIAGPVHRDVVRVPVQAVFYSEGRPTVFRIKDGTPSRIPVTLGLSDLDHVEIVEGLAAGDSIALEDPAVAAERAGSARRR